MAKKPKKEKQDRGARAWQDLGSPSKAERERTRLPDLGTPTYTAHDDGLHIDYPTGDDGVLPWDELFEQEPAQWGGLVYGAMHEIRHDAWERANPDPDDMDGA